MPHAPLSLFLGVSLIAAGSLPAAAQATAGLELPHDNATLTTVLKESQLTAQFGGSYLDQLKLAVLPNGDVVFAGASQSSNIELYHLNVTTGFVTRIVTTQQIQQVTGYPITLSAWIDVDGMAADASGNVYVFVHGWDWMLQGPADLHLLQVPLSGAAPAGFGAPVSLFSKPHAIAGEITMDIDLIGNLHLVVDDGDPVNDALPGPLPNGVYTLPHGTTSPQLLATYASLAPVLSGGGPLLTGDVTTHEDIGARNVAAGLFKTYLTMSETSNSGVSWDTTAGELHDGDIVEVDHVTGLGKVLVPKRRYLEVTNSLFQMDRGLRTNVRDISLVADLQRNRLYTWENDYQWTGPYRHLSLLQWDLATGAFERVVVPHKQVVDLWAQDGDTPLVGSFILHNLVPKGDSMRLAPDGSLLVQLQAFSQDGGDRLVRITPKD